VEGIAKKKRVRARNPLEPLQTINWMILSLLLLGSAWGAFGALTGHGGGSILGFGTMSVCVNDTGMGDAVTGLTWLTPRPGVSMTDTGLQLCTSHPTTAQRWWYSLEKFPTTATAMAVTLTIFFALQQAHLRGLYIPGFASKLRFLGWFLVVESIAQSPIESFADSHLWHTMADGGFNHIWGVAWYGLLAGIALLSLARIMRVGSAMREDLEGVV
jgi:hypothetical protein